MALVDRLNASALAVVFDMRNLSDRLDEVTAAAMTYAGGSGISYPLDLLAEKINRVRKELPSSYDAVARILALARPIVEVVFIECGIFEPEAPRTGRGKPPASPVTLMLIHLLAKVGTIQYYRQVCRELAAHPAWLKALHLDKAPDHSTLYSFRKKMGLSFFKTFFHKLTALLVAFGLLKGDDAAIVDSAPVEARMNFARSNTLPKLDLDRLHDFFAAVDFKQALAARESPCGRGRKPKFDSLAMVKYLAFEQLAGFLCRTQGPRYLKKHPDAAALLGFAAGDVPTDQNIAAFERRNPPLGDLLAPVMGEIQAFFESVPPSGNSGGEGGPQPFFLDS